MADSRSRTKSGYEVPDSFRAIADRSPDAVLLDDLEGHVVYANDAFCRLFGLTPNELTQLALEDYVAPEWRAQLRDRHDRRMRGEPVPAQFIYRGLTKHGQWSTYPSAGANKRTTVT